MKRGLFFFLLLILIAIVSYSPQLKSQQQSCWLQDDPGVILTNETPVIIDSLINLQNSKFRIWSNRFEAFQENTNRSNTDFLVVKSSSSTESCQYYRIEVPSDNNSVSYYGASLEIDDCGNRKVLDDNFGKPLTYEEVEQRSKIFISNCSQFNPPLNVTSNITQNLSQPTENLTLGCYGLDESNCLSKSECKAIYKTETISQNSAGNGFFALFGCEVSHTKEERIQKYQTCIPLENKRPVDLEEGCFYRTSESPDETGSSVCQRENMFCSSVSLSNLECDERIGLMACVDCIVCCSGVPDCDYSSPEELVLNPSLKKYAETESNDNWESADKLFLGDFSQNRGDTAVYREVTIDGSISAQSKDLDTFQINVPQINLVYITIDSQSDTQVALFDEDYNLLGFFDPVSSTAGPQEIRFYNTERLDSFFVSVSTRTTSPNPRPYNLKISLSNKCQPPSTRPQKILLDFNGGQDIQIGFRSPISFPPFDIATINPSLSGKNSQVKSAILQKVREDYSEYNVQVYSTEETETIAGDHITLYFGGDDPKLLGLADNIDPYNLNQGGNAIIYTETFSLFNALNPSQEEYETLLANVASHEIAHLLGLRHTSDPEEIEDVTATARQMLKNQDFKRAPLHVSVAPVGYQNSTSMFENYLGRIK